jgi:hypothetical protein
MVAVGSKRHGEQAVRLLRDELVGGCWSSSSVVVLEDLLKIQHRFSPP